MYMPFSWSANAHCVIGPCLSRRTSPIVCNTEHAQDAHASLNCVQQHCSYCRCVLFTNSSAPSKRQEAASEAWEELAGDEDKAVIFAAVDAAGSPKLAARFGLKQFPLVRLFRDRQVSALGRRCSIDAVHKMQQF